MPAVLTQQEAKKRRDAISRTMSRLSQRDNISPEDYLEFNKLEREFRDLGPLAHDNSRSSTRPPNGPIEGQEQRNTPRETWVDCKTGNEVAVLGPGDSFRSAAPSFDSRAAEVGLGKLVRAMLLGSQNEQERRALQESIVGDGGYLLPTLVSEQVIDLLRAEARTIQAGARTVKMPTAYFNMARLASDPVPMWRGENGPINESSPTFEAVMFRAKSFGTYVKISRELIEDASNLDDVLKGAFAKSMALALDYGALYGQNPNNSPIDVTEPLGVAWQPGITTTAFNAPITSYQPILDAALALAEANSPPPTACIMNPSVEWEFNSLVDTLHQPLQRPVSIENLPFLSTTKLPTNESGGSPQGNDTSSIFTGYWPNLMIGMRSELRIDKLVERFADYGQIGVLVFARADVQLAHPASFVRTTGVM